MEWTCPHCWKLPLVAGAAQGGDVGVGPGLRSGLLWAELKCNQQRIILPRWS